MIVAPFCFKHKCNHGPLTKQSPKSVSILPQLKKAKIQERKNATNVLPVNMNNR